MKKLLLIACATVLLPSCTDDTPNPFHRDDTETESRAADPVFYVSLSNPGRIHDRKGREVLLGRIKDMHENGYGYAPAFVTKAPNDQPFTMSCVMLDKRGGLLGGGTTQGLRRGRGTAFRFDYTVKQQANVRCSIDERFDTSTLGE
jgi:hypothetical protein